MDKKSKAKLIWTVTSYGCKRFGTENIALKIAKNHLNAVRAIYYPAAATQISELRDQIARHVEIKDQYTVKEQVPFLLSLVGRKAILSIPQDEITVADNSTLELSFCVDFAFCAAQSMENSISNKIEVRVSCEDQLQKLKKNSCINISYGAVELKIQNITKKSESELDVQCLVVNGGKLFSGMNVHSSDMPRDLFPLLPDDEKTLQQRFSDLADFVIVDGLKSDEEFFAIKKMIIGEQTTTSLRHPSVAITKNIRERDAILPPRFLLKIESKRSLELLPSLITHIDGVFLSRSELGIDEHPHNLAILQKDLIAQCNKASKTIIVSSELMHSMHFNVNPTRAEVSDMANAAADGADALVLSHEITEGRHADLVAQISQETLLTSEAWADKKWHSIKIDKIFTDDDAVTYGAIRIAEQGEMRAIVCFTEGGYTAMKLSALRTPAEIIAITFNKRIMRQLNLLRSVTAVIIEPKAEMETLVTNIKEILTNNFDFKKNDKFVFVSLTASSLAQRNSNFFTVQEI